MNRLIYLLIVLTLGLFFSSTKCDYWTDLIIENNSSDTIYFALENENVELTTYKVFQIPWAYYFTIPPQQNFTFTYSGDKYKYDETVLQLLILSNSTINKYGMEKIVDLNIMDAYYRFSLDGYKSKEYKIIYNGEKYDDRL